MPSELPEATVTFVTVTTPPPAQMPTFPLEEI